MSEHRVIFDDARDMRQIPSESVHLVVTSPPYWSIKDYGHDKQIGLGESWDEYLSSMSSVLRECYRALNPGCRMAINIGDQYLRKSDYGRYRVQPIPAYLTMVGLDIGLDFMGNIIWRKISNTNTTGGCSLMGSMYHPKDGHVTYEHEYILLFRKRGDWSRPDDEVKAKSRLTKEERTKWFRGVWDDVPPVSRQDRHVAMFPVELPRRLIKMYSFWGETILDPFLGSGTTAQAAAMEERNSIGYEINPKLKPVIAGRLGTTGREKLEDDHIFEIGAV